MGLVVAMLSITGVAIWARKRRAQRRVEAHHERVETSGAI